MFDPAKLDLNLDDSEKKVEETGTKNENQNEVTSNQEEAPIVVEEKKPEENNPPKSESNENYEDFKDKITDNTNENDEKKETVEPIAEEKNIIFNINITSLQDILTLLIEKQYDFVLLEPETEAIKISFRKDKIEKEAHFIKYPVYSKILLKAKTLTNLVIDETEETQEWNWEAPIKNQTYKITSKVVPSELGEKLFLKAKILEKKIKKPIKKTSISQILWFLWAIAFISLIIGWAFVGFVVLNAKTVEDVKFFYSLGINLNDINNFITQLITFIFSILLLIESVFLIMYLFRFSLTRKEFKQKKIRYGILWAFFLILTLSTASIWMIIDRQVKSLPNWQEMAYGDVQIYDNSKLTSNEFEKWGSLIEDTTNIIWPIEIKFDLTFFAQKEEQKWTRISKFIWDFWEKDIQETQTPVIIREFNTKWNQEVSLTVEQVDLKGNVTEKIIENIPDINISYVVEKTEKKLNSWGKLVDFDASSLSQLWKIEWYFLDDLSKPVWKWYTFKVWRPIFEETLVGMYIRRNDKTSEALDKIFIISEDDQSNIWWEILYTRGIINDIEFDISVKDIENDFWEWFIEEYKWLIDGKEITKIGNIESPSESSKVKYTFKSYGPQEVKVLLKNSWGKTKELSTTIDIPQNIKLKSNLRIYNNDEILEDVLYEEKLNEYYINEIGTPTTLKLDARFIRADNLLYTLKEVNWDFNSDGDIDETKKLVEYDLSTPWNYTITAEYTFVHRKVAEDIIQVKETIFVEGMKKEAILDLQVDASSEYAPSVVKFDASKSIIKNEDIAKFVWDYGDGVIYEWDAIIPWHKYSLPGEYEIKLKIVTQSWKDYSISKKLIIKPKSQSVSIDVSMKKTFVNAGIDFSSSKSEWQIVSYLWNFWDGAVSTEPNPTHSYRKAGNYDVSLKVDFANNNILEDKIKIEILEEE